MEPGGGWGKLAGILALVIGTSIILGGLFPGAGTAPHPASPGGPLPEPTPPPTPSGTSNAAAARPMRATSDGRLSRVAPMSRIVISSAPSAA